MFGRKKAATQPSPIPRPVNPDLVKERQKCTFNTLELTYFLDGGAHNYKERKEKEDFFLSDPELIGGTPPELLSHEDQYRDSLRKSNRMTLKVKEREKKFGKVADYRKRVGLPIYSAIFKDGNPMSLHNVMFIPTLLGQATPGQISYWLPRAEKNEILGTYAQTELGHGTFLRGLETKATYLPDTEQFELISPTVSSYKWWPGGLGHTVNYAIIMAQLYTKGKCHGIHPFIVQLRDERTYRPMPGIKIGEIGRKLGMNATNNGFLAFDKVHIPRAHLLMRNARVEPDGTYVKSKNSKLAYGTMIYVRVIIVEDVAFFISKVATIGVRYSAVRRQSEMRPGEPEPQILDYQTQQYKLLPYIAYYYAFRFSAAWLSEMYHKITADVRQGNLEQLPELHALACCLKAVCTSDCSKGVETIRLACGGHGYMTASNLPTTYGIVTATCTYEGENTVMLLQTARALMKAWSKAQAGEELSITMAYLMPGAVSSQPWTCSLERLALGFKQIAAAKVSGCARMIQQGTAAGLDAQDAWNQASVQLVQAAEAHGRAFLVDRYVQTVRTGMNSLSPELHSVMVQLCELYTVYWTLLCAGDFIMYAGVGADDVTELQQWQSRLLSQIRPNAVGLVDSFDYHDAILSSALGSYDGQVYDRLLESALMSPLNAKPVHDSFRTSIEPLLKAKY